MEVKDIVNRDLVNLKNCESEPIHIPGSIQPHGFLLAFDEFTGRIVFCSENAREFLGIAAKDILTKTFSDVFGDAGYQQARAYPDLGDKDGAEPVLLHTVDNHFTAVTHRASKLIITEAEPLPDGSLPLPNLYRQTGRFASYLQKPGDLLSLCETIAQETRNITGYDRVMIYRFDENYNGEVIAESKRADLPSLAGQKYPHTDIPAQARELYLRSPLRMIGDVNYLPVPVLTAAAGNEHSNRSLDMSFCLLRSVSPMHIEYLKNMGVGATLTISLLLEGKLWGLIACHHYTAKILPHFVRLSALLQGYFLTSQILVRETAEEFSLGRECELHLTSLLACLSSNGKEFVEKCFREPALLQLVHATAVCIIYRGILYCNGDVPATENTQRLFDAVRRISGKKPFHTNELARDLGWAAGETLHAAGVIYYPLSEENDDCIMWLRKEIVEIVKWAGNPYKKETSAQHTSLLTPRKSFELWIEEMRGKSYAWKKSELHAAESFAYALEKYISLNIAQLQESRFRELSEKLKEANRELSNLHWISTHDLKEPVRKIQIFASMALEREDALSEKTRDNILRMSAAATKMQALIDDLLSYSRAVQSDEMFVPTNLNELVEDCMRELQDDPASPPVDLRVKILPVISAIPFQAKQLFTNVLSNAVKFTASKEAIEITIDSDVTTGVPGVDNRADTRFHHISIADNGIGFEPKFAELIFDIFRRLHTESAYRGTGIGLAICKKIMDNHKGVIRASGIPGEGAVFDLYFPVK